MTIVDSLLDAKNAAQYNGFRPARFELGETKWEQWQEYVHMLSLLGLVTGPCVVAAPPHFLGIPIVKGTMPGIVLCTS